MKRERVPESGSRVRKRATPSTRFHQRYTEKRGIRGSKFRRRKGFKRSAR